LRRPKGITFRPLVRIWSVLPRASVASLPDLIMFSGGLALFYGLVEVGRNWLGPFHPQVEISRSLGALPVYAGYSLLRIALAYVLSLLFAVTFGYVAAYRPRAERFMIPLLDVLQSIPVLSFLPGVMLAMAALFPGRQLGVEMGAVLLIFTGQVWNMAFSFYASLKSIPREMREAATIYRFNWWQRFLQIELPFATIGLVWNSMMSVAGAWFFLMACEQFGDFRLPGLGSYLQAAADHGDTRSIVLGILTMVAVIVLIDQFVWRPVIAWAEKFKMEQVESASAPTSWVLDFLRRSRGVALFRKGAVRPLREQMVHYFAHRNQLRSESTDEKPAILWLWRIVGIAALSAIGYAVVRVVMILTGLPAPEFRRDRRRPRRNLPARESYSGTGRPLDDPGWCRHRLQPAPGAHRSAPRADCRLGPGHGVVSSGAARLDSAGWRPGRGLDRTAAARHPVVHSLQCDRRSHRHSHRSERSCQRVRHSRLGALAHADFAWNLSFPGYGHDHRFRRRLECQHCRRVFPFQGSDLFDGWCRGHDFRGHGCQELRSAPRQHHRPGGRSGNNQPIALAPVISSCRNTFQTGELVLSFRFRVLSSQLSVNPALLNFEN
jgi:ABC-type nitrate/sulfonate/bicarbonate transport system permease component